jgi:hypothetical protein
MPLYRSSDDSGYYYKWGKRGRKYYFTPGDENSRYYAMLRALDQGRAIHANIYGAISTRGI